MFIAFLLVIAFTINSKFAFETRVNHTQIQTSGETKIKTFDPNTGNIYHLYTRRNPAWSQVLEHGNQTILSLSNYDDGKRTFLVIHGWLGSIGDNFNYRIVNALLFAGDFNIISLDWNAGAAGHYLEAVDNTVLAARHATSFLDWLIGSTATTVGDLTIIGHSLGGHVAGMTARHVRGDVYYVVALDPALPNWITHEEAFRSTDALYTEVIHSMGGVQGLLTPQGMIDFYPNGGIAMPNCQYSDDEGCSHHMAVIYYAESLVTGGFTATSCEDYVHAIYGNCVGSTIHMGGLHPKIGYSGSFYLRTDVLPPYSLD